MRSRALIDSTHRILDGVAPKRFNAGNMSLLRRTVLIAMLTGLSGCHGAGQANADTLEMAKAQFARFTALEGKWRVVGGDHAKGATHSYRTIANGSVVVEVAFPGEQHEMVTVVHLDGSDLVLTHYCAAGNQPHLVAAASDGNDVQFQFVKAGNLSSPEAAHMRDARFVFVGKDKVRQHWSFWQGGKQVSEMTSELERVRE